MRTRLFIDIIKILTLTSLLGLSACGGGGNQENSIGIIDTTSPTFLLSRSFTPSVIDANTTIIIAFSESMDTTSLHLDGNLSTESNSSLWIKSNVVNDTLTITSPVDTNWSVGSTYSLMIDANDLAGNPLSTLSFNFVIKSGAFIYVNAAMADDTGDGLTPSTAYKFIPTAVTAAQTPSTVLVAQGEHNVSYAANTHITIKEGVSLYGGFDGSFQQRDSTQYLTTIHEGSERNSASFSRTIEGSGNIVTATTVIDGFNIEGNTHSAPPGYSFAIYLTNGASPTIQNNTINGGYSEHYSHGIECFNSSPTIQNNIINGGYTGGDTEGFRIGYSFAISTNNNSSPIIQNNTIDGGSGGAYSFGIDNSDSSPEIRNNIIDGGSGGGYSYGINNSYSSPFIQGNRIYAGGNERSRTVGIANSDSSPTIQGNDIDGGGNGGSTSAGVHNRDSAPLIQNNTIDGGHGWFETYGIHNISSSSTIENNTIHSGDGEYHYIIYDE